MKLNYKRTILIGLAFMSISAFWQMYDNEISKMLQYTFGIGETVVGVIMSLDNILALFLLPIFGSLSDKVNTKHGKRMPFIIVGTILAIIFLMILPFAQSTLNLPLFIGALLLLLISMGTYRSPAVALMPDLTPKPLRSKANAVINLMGAVGGVFTLLMINLFVKEGASYYPLMIAVAAFMAICVIILFLTIKENKLRAKMAPEEPEEAPEVVANGDAKSKKLPKDVMQSLVFLLASVAFWFIAYNAVTTAFSRYAKEVWGLDSGYTNCLLIATVAAIISYIPIGAIASKIGRKKTIMIGIVLLGLCFFAAGLFDQYSNAMIIFFCIIGFAWAAIGVNSYPMVVEMANAGDVGKYTGLYYTFSMSAQVVTPILSGWLLEHVSYRTLFPYAVIFCVLALITMSQVRHGDSKPMQKKDVLENFDIDD
ncbi:MAG: MFS transporter [Agathobacter sp.]|nr:MFS transporter [Agathobacter sp.]